MIALMTRSLLIAALCLCITVPVAARDAETGAATEPVLAAKQGQSDGNRDVRGSRIGPEDDGTAGTRAKMLDDGNMRDDGRLRMTDNGVNNGTYRARAAENRTNWSWLGLLGLVGLAGLMRGDNRNRDRA